MNETLERITLGGGCFWCTEAVYERVRGVRRVESGYCNGHVDRPTYEAVCSGSTGHAEVVRLDFDPAKVSLRELLEVFFVIHDPTSLNRQGADVGTQYRSGVYLADAGQAEVVRAVMVEAQAVQNKPLVTEVALERNYSAAEAHHQHFFARNPDQGYCAFVVAAKVDKFLNTFAKLTRE